jgi:hypothetical protein
MRGEGEHQTAHIVLMLCSKLKNLSTMPRRAQAQHNVDYIFRWLDLKFVTLEQGELLKALSHWISGISLFRPLDIPTAYL